MGDEAAYLTVQPSGKLCTTRQGLRASRTGRQHDIPPSPTTTRPDMGDETAHLVVKPSGKLYTTRQGLHAHRTGRQHEYTTATDKARHGR